MTFCSHLIGRDSLMELPMDLSGTKSTRFLNPSLYLVSDKIQQTYYLYYAKKGGRGKKQSLSLHLSKEEKKAKSSLRHSPGNSSTRSCEQLAPGVGS